MSAIDNLVKGAAGGAVQWMNRLWGLPETDRAARTGTSLDVSMDSRRCWPTREFARNRNHHTGVWAAAVRAGARGRVRHLHRATVAAFWIFTVATRLRRSVTVTRQLDRSDPAGSRNELLFQSNAVALDIRAQAAEALISITPENLTRAFFVNSGAEANENALRMALVVNGAQERYSRSRRVFTGARLAAGAVTWNSRRSGTGSRSKPFEVDFIPARRHWCRGKP